MAAAGGDGMRDRTGYKIVVGSPDNENIPHLQRELNELAFDDWRVVSTVVRPDGMWVVLLERTLTRVMLDPDVTVWRAKGD
jgi:hypothetical protein